MQTKNTEIPDGVHLVSSLILFSIYTLNAENHLVSFSDDVGYEPYLDNSLNSSAYSSEVVEGVAIAFGPPHSCSCMAQILHNKNYGLNASRKKARERCLETYTCTKETQCRQKSWRWR